MRIGIFPDEKSVYRGALFPGDYLGSHEAVQRGINANPLHSIEDLNTHGVECVQLMGVNQLTLQYSRELFRRKIPYLVFSNAVGASNTQIIRLVRAGGKLIANLLLDHLKNIPIASSIYAGSAKVMVHSQRQASIIERGFDIPQEKIVVVRPIIDERFLHADASSFKQKFGIDSFIFAIADDFRPSTNMLRLLVLSIKSIFLLSSGKYPPTKFSERMRTSCNQQSAATVD